MKKSSKSALSTTVAVILTAVIVGSVVGGATSYIFMSSTDSTVQEVRADVKAVADAIGVPVDKPDELKKLMDERKLIEAARQEGKVVVYTQGNPPTNDAVRRAFESRYPFITVEFVVNAPGLPVADRFLSESEKGGKSADVLNFNQVNIEQALAKGELLAKYTPRNTEWATAELKDKGGRWVANGIILFSIAYNTKLVSKDQAPKSFQDLLDPKWSGKIVVGNPKANTLWADLLKASERQYGEDFMRKLEAQKIRYYPPGEDTYAKLAAGEYSLLLFALPAFAEGRKAAGQPMDWVRLSDNTYFQNLAMAVVVADAPHPNAARLFVDWFFSKEGNQIRADTGGIVTMPGVRLASPDLALQGKKLIPVETLSDAERQAFFAKYPGLAAP